MKCVSRCELREVALLLAIDRRPGPVCFSWKFSSFEKCQEQDRQNMEKDRTGNLSPYIENDPVPSPFRKSPPAYEYG